MKERLGKKFYIKMIAVPFGAVVVLAIVQGVVHGFGSVLSNWETLLGTFVFIAVTLAIILFLVSRRLEGFFNDVKKHPIAFVIALFVNAALLISAKPDFILASPQLKEYLPLFIIVGLAWLCFPVIASEKFDKSSFFKKIPEIPKMLFGFVVYMITLFSVLILAIVDTLAVLFFVYAIFLAK